MKDARELARTIGGIAPGNSVKLNVLHKGEDKVVNLTLGQLPNAVEAKADADNNDNGRPTRGTDVPKLGLTVAPANSVAGAGKEGVVVTEVDPKSAATERGFKEGDVILEVAGKERYQCRRRARRDQGGSLRQQEQRADAREERRIVALRRGAAGERLIALRDGGCRRHSRPRRRLFPGGGPSARSLRFLSAEYAPLRRKVKRAVKFPPASPPAFFDLRQR